MLPQLLGVMDRPATSSTNSASWSEDSESAEISDDGLLTTLPVVGDQTMTITATFVNGLETENRLREVTIVDLVEGTIIFTDGFETGDSCAWTPEGC